MRPECLPLILRLMRAPTMAGIYVKQTNASISESEARAFPNRLREPTVRATPTLQQPFDLNNACRLFGAILALSVL